MKRMLTIILFAAACSGGGKGKGGGGGEGGGTVAETYTLVSIESGDAACYVTVKDSTGAENTHPGSFDLCPGGPADASNLIGFPVALGWTKANVIAPSCEGNPECADTEETNIVSTIDPVKPVD
jgi:hypothetical protein